MNEENLISYKLLKWYDANKNDYPWRKTKNLFQILITEILLQKTIAKNVNSLFDSFFTKYKSFSDIIAEKIEVIQADIKSLGLSNKRAKILKDLSEMIINQYNGEIPEDPEALKQITGIADYVSNAYLCFGLNQKRIFFDVNIERIISRVYKPNLPKIPKTILIEKLEGLLPNNECKYFYWSLLDFGNKVCSKKKPKCDGCPITDTCGYHLQSQIK